MLAFVPALVFVLGVAMASFVGVVVARLSTGGRIVHDVSKCDACNTPLTPRMLVPVLSYLMLRGRAACCGARISAAAPISELCLGALYVLAYSTHGLTLTLLAFLAALTLTLALVLYDLAHQILPGVLLYPLVGVSVLYSYLAAPTLASWYASVGVATFIAGVLAGIHLLSRGRAMGMADIPLAFGLALLAAPYALTGFVLSFWIGAVVGIVLLAQRPRRTKMNSEIPFAPFLALGFLLAYFTQWNLFELLLLLS